MEDIACRRPLETDEGSGWRRSGGRIGRGKMVCSSSKLGRAHLQHYRCRRSWDVPEICHVGCACILLQGCRFRLMNGVSRAFYEPAVLVVLNGVPEDNTACSLQAYSVPVNAGLSNAETGEQAYQHILDCAKAISKASSCGLVGVWSLDMTISSLCLRQTILKVASYVVKIGGIAKDSGMIYTFMAAMLVAVYRAVPYVELSLLAMFADKIIRS